MTFDDIIAELPKLTLEDREKIVVRILELQGTGRPNGVDLHDWEKQALDKAWAEYEQDPEQGRPWREVMAELRGIPAE